MSFKLEWCILASVGSIPLDFDAAVEPVGVRSHEELHPSRCEAG